MASSRVSKKNFIEFNKQNLDFMNKRKSPKNKVKPLNFKDDIDEPNIIS